MPFYVYVLRSVSSGRSYVGQTEDVAKRLAEHNSNRAPSTKNRGPWELVRQEEYATRSEAAKRERQIKGMKSRRWIEELLERPDELDREGRQFNSTQAHQAQQSVGDRD
jgi:putative endonuclease